MSVQLLPEAMPADVSVSLGDSLRLVEEATSRRIPASIEFSRTPVPNSPFVFFRWVVTPLQRLSAGWISLRLPSLPPSVSLSSGDGTLRTADGGASVRFRIDSHPILRAVRLCGPKRDGSHRLVLDFSEAIQLDALSEESFRFLRDSSAVRCLSRNDWRGGVAGNQLSFDCPVDVRRAAFSIQGHSSLRGASGVRASAARPWEVSPSDWREFGVGCVRARGPSDLPVVY